MDDEKLKEYIKFQYSRNIISLYKKYFEMIDDLKHDHENMLKKIADNSSEDFAENVDYFNDWPSIYTHICTFKKFCPMGETFYT